MMQATVKDITGAPFEPSPAADAVSVQPYLRSFGLQSNPFPVVPDATGFYMSRRNETIVTEMLHAIESRKGFMVITGEVGLGKTTLSRRMLMELEKRGIQTALVINTFHQEADLLHEITRDFGIAVDTHELMLQMSALNEFLLKNLALGVNCAIIIDDAQQLSIESLELVRQVSNLETNNEKLVQILLIGQPELDVKLNSRALRQLKSRIALRHFVTPYTIQQTREYVQTKLIHAGDRGLLQVTAPAFRRLQRLTGGNPRQINMLMDRCLYATIAFGSDRINRRLLNHAASEFRSLPNQDTVSRPNLLTQSLLLLLLLIILATLLLNPAVRKSRYAVGDVLYSWLSQPEVPWPLNINRVKSQASVLTITAPVTVPEPITSHVNPGVIAAAKPALKTVAEAVSHPALKNEENDRPALEKIATSPAIQTRVTTPKIAGVPAPVPVSGQPDRGVLLSFLKAYKLERYLSKIQGVWSTGQIDVVADEITRSTGLRMVALTTLPDGIHRYPLLKVNGSGQGENKFLLFWRPLLWTKAYFSYSYHRNEMQALQKSLQQLGYYQGQIDGFAGPLTNKALRTFQVSVHLPPSGTPDVATLFLLESLGVGPHPGGSAAEST